MPVIAHSVAHWPRLVRPQCRSSSHEHGVSCAPIGAWRRRWPTHTFANELRAVSGDTAAADAQQPSIAEPEESNQPKISQQQAEPKIALKDVEVGKTYKSKVMKIMPYGAFVDIGAESDALVHISELSKRFVEKVGDVLDVGETLDVKVIKLDVESGRISCSIKALLPNASTPVEKKDGGRRTQQQRRRPRMNGQAKGGRDRPIKAPPMKIGEEVKGKVDTILAWGAFISLENGERALLHVTEIRQAFTEFEESKPNANDFLEEGQELTLRVRSIDRKGQVAVTERTAEEIKRVNELSQSGLQYTPEDAPPQMMEGLFGNAGITRNMFPDMPERVAFDEEYEEAQADIGSKGGVPLREAEQPAPAVAQAEKTILKQTTGDSVAEAVEEVQDKSEPAPVEEVKVDSVPAPPPPVQEEPVPALAVETSPTPESQMSNGANSEGTKTEDAAPVKISAQLVKELRVMTGAGMMDCKKALKECDGELEEAVEYLRKKGIATAAKKAGRIASEGLIHSHVHEGGKTGILLEVNCETDFVARGDQFRELVDDIAKQIAECPDVVCITTDEVPADLLASGNPKEAFALLEQPFFRNTEKTVGQLLTETTAALGEKIAVRRFERYTLSDPLVGPTTEEGKDLMGGIGCYVHAGRQGVMVEISCETDDVAQGDAFKELLMDAALQITASPDVQYVSRDDVPSGVVEKEKEIEMGKEDLLSKPEQMRAKISEGRVEKTLNTQCLLNQPFVKDQNKTVADVLKDVSEATGEGVVVRRFTRFLVGEGLEKRSNDFAAEVAAQMQSA